MLFYQLCRKNLLRSEFHTKNKSKGNVSLLNFFFSLLFCQPVQEPEKMTQIIVEALEKTGQRGIINKGWGGLGNCKFLL